MNIEKLGDEIAKASAEKAEKELDRMIKLHQDEADKWKNSVKLYLHQIGTVVGKATDYSIATGSVAEVIKHEAAVKFLKELKEELK